MHRCREGGEVRELRAHIAIPRGRRSPGNDGISEVQHTCTSQRGFVAGGEVGKERDACPLGLVQTVAPTRSSIG